MLPLSAFLFLVLNLLPSSPTLRLHHHAPAGCFAVAAAADAENRAPASLRAGGRALAGNSGSLTPPTGPQPAQGFNAMKPPGGPTAPNAAIDPSSFSALVWGNSLNNSTNTNTNTSATMTPQQQQQQQQQPASPAAAPATTNDNNPGAHTNGGGNDDPRYMIHLMQVNSSSWRDPAGVTFYQAEVRCLTYCCWCCRLRCVDD